MTGLLFTAYLIILAVGYGLTCLNLDHLKRYGGTVPPELAGVVEPGVLQRISNYTLEMARLGMVESIVRNALVLLFLFGGLLGTYDRWVISMAGMSSRGGVLFFFGLLLAGSVLDLPFSLVRNFSLEKRYGFNTMTLRTWVADVLKSLAVSSVLGLVAVLSVLALIRWSPQGWWFWVWLFFLFFGIFLMYLSPLVIEPLFFKFEPLKAEGLEARVRELMERAGLTVSRVFQVDASRRSRHSNAYFTGIGRVKRIVLFDTLIEQMDQEEVLAVLAHEAGHWKRRHVLKRIILSETTAFIGTYLTFRLLSWEGLPGILGLEGTSLYANVVIIGFLGSIALFPLTPFFSFLSRRHEREADRFAAVLTGQPEAMASALVKLSRENLSNLHPHPWYVAFYYSHPPVLERVRSLRGQGGAPG